MKKIIAYLLILIMAHSVQSQTLKNYQIGQGRSLLILDEESSSIESHKYLSNDWIKGNMVTNTDGLLSNVEFKYDILNDKIEFKSTLNPSSIRVVTIGDKFFIHTEFVDGSFTRSGYFQMLYEGKSKLLLRRTVKIVPGKKGAYGFSSYSTTIEQYYVQLGDNPAIPFEKRKSDIVDILMNEKAEIKSFVESKKINTKKDSDLIALLEYFDSL